MPPILLQTHLTYGKYACIRFHRIENILIRENLIPLPSHRMGVVFFTYLHSR
ncbi:MAG: hypothetical protein K2O31_04315 [Clostridia bacterium]|nr:hypothetical protein [Clostridia bacterium]